MGRLKLFKMFPIKPNQEEEDNPLAFPDMREDGDPKELFGVGLKKVMEDE